MADVRCPMCGKPNAAELEVCQFCAARLKPLVIKSPPEESQDIGDIGEEKTQPRSSGAADEDIPDWLRSLRPDSEADSGAGGKATGRDAAPDFSEWPSGKPSERNENQIARPAFEKDSADDDWLSSFRDGSGLEGETLPADDDSAWSGTDDKPMPDWLTDFRSAAPQEQASTNPTNEPAESEEPEWLLRIRDRKKTETETDPSQLELSEDEPQTSLTAPSQGKFESFDSPPASVGIPSFENDMPDWLSGLGDSATEDDDQGFPAWLMSGSSTDKASEDENNLPAWLSGAKKEAQPAVPSPKQPPKLPTPPADGELPQPEAGAHQAEQIPGWLSGYVIKDSEASPEKISSEEEHPSWLSDLEKKAALEQAHAADATSHVDSEWMDAQGIQTGADLVGPTPQLPGEGAGSVAPFTFSEDDAFITDELPDWLRSASPQDTQTEATAAADAESNLSPAELPVWLEAMRPVEAITTHASLPDERDQKAEGSGPLAGLRGILRAEPDTARQKKPAAYTIKLQVSESHQAHVALLENLIKSEGAVRPVPSGLAVTSQQILRWIIFVVLLVAVAWPVYTGSQNVPLPSISPEVIDARGVIDAVPNGSPVLVAVEYEPGFSGELDAAAAAIIDHLMIKGAYLTLVSSSPVGPAQAEYLVGVLNRTSGHSYAPVGQYANLGYIPGGTAGLQAFAGSPRRVLPLSLEIIPGNASIWDGGPLASIRSLSDFALTLVITENPDTARAWVEQVQPALGGKPLVMVVSAQAEPLVRPYYAGIPRQVQGMVVGLAGGAGYESMMPRPGLVRQYWDAFSYGLAAAVALIVIAGLFNILASFLASRRRPEGEA